MKRFLLCALFVANASCAMHDDLSEDEETPSLSLASALGIQCMFEGVQAAFSAAASDERVQKSFKDLESLLSRGLHHQQESELQNPDNNNQ